MEKPLRSVRLKGGSLSETCLMTRDNGDSFVRKSISLVKNREYGFQRWYSQLKRLQRYDAMFPGMFPRVLSYGMNGDKAYFDIEYFAEAQNAQEFVEGCRDEDQIHGFFAALMESLATLHRQKLVSVPQAIELYIHEEVEQRIRDCRRGQRFADFLQYDHIVFNGHKVVPLVRRLEEYKEAFRKYYHDSHETFTHGNITLENILYIPMTKQVILIDPYEENIIDSSLAEYSQLFQSCHARYEIYNRGEAAIAGSAITMAIEKSWGMDCFENLLTQHLKQNYSREEHYCIQLLEISQFIRMLPFKMALDENKMLFFYGLASYLFDQFLDQNQL